jgi:Holliday junction resolvasome RuvABC ATP-dependent DNA helicase subunit
LTDQGRPHLDRTVKATAIVPQHVVYRSFEAETLLLNLETGQYHGLNQIGGRMLELLNENDGQVGKAVEALADECGMEPDEIEDDLVSFCAELAKRGLIEVDGARDP